MILVGDVGGTRTRLALAGRAEGGWMITRIAVSKTVPGILEAVAGYVKDAGVALEAAAFGGAGTLAADGSIRLTNADVLLEPAALAGAARVRRVVVVNDFGAIAHSIPHLPAESLLPIGGGGARVAGMPVAVLGPGTGLGIAFGTPASGGWTVIAGDGGHADLAPVDDDEHDAWLALRRAHGRVSAETVLCGPGLERLHAAVGGDAGMDAAAIDAAAWRGDPQAMHAHALFTRWLGRVAGNLALVAGAQGGVFLAGGILPRWAARFDVAEFRRGFEDKAPFSAWLATVPTFLVTHPQPGLVGLAVLGSAAA